jgi:all-trans-8'-apo-beta-carotenal 15,15'-oxygenase
VSVTPDRADRAGRADLAPLLERAFDTVPEEGSYRIEPSEGAVPEWLRGTYYLNGPARFRRGETAYGHWLDGDGMVCSLRFDGEGDQGGPRFTARFVRSEKWVREEEAGCSLFRCFGTGFPGDQLLRGIALASPVNVSVYPFAGKLLAFGEQGLPWELDPETLETVGEHTFGGRLNAVSPFSAHPGFDHSHPIGQGEAKTSGEMVNFGVSFSAQRPTLNLYRFGDDGGLLYRKRVPLPYPASIHDFGLSKRYAVFYVNPYLLDMRPLMEAGASVLDCLSWRPELGSSLLVVERESGEVAATVPIGERYCLHHVNAFERDGLLVVDVLELEEPVYPDYTPVPDLFAEVAPAHPVRYVLDLAGGEAGESGGVVERREAPYRLAADFPAVDPRRAGEPTDHFWMLAISRTGEPGRKFLDRLVAIDFGLEGEDGEEAAEADAWQAPPGRYLGGEPVFVPRPGSRDGVIVVQELDAEAREMAFLLFDAYRLADGPVARLPLRRPVHLGFHACWDPA